MTLVIFQPGLVSFIIHNYDRNFNLLITNKILNKLKGNFKYNQ